MGERGNELYKDLPRSGMHSAALWPVLSGSGRLGDPTGLDARHRAGRPLPEGFYFSNTADWGVRDPSIRLLVDHPVYIWSTPWMILGARFHVLAETALDANERGGRHAGGFYNPLLTGQLAWDLGNGFGFSYTFGAYFDVHQELAWSSTSITQRFALSYTGGGWNLTANVIYGIHLDAITDRPQISPCPAPFGLNGCKSELRQRRSDGDQDVRQMGAGPSRFWVHGPERTHREVRETKPIRGRLVGWIRLRPRAVASVCHQRCL
jgi:hypothetical protein